MPSLVCGATLSASTSSVTDGTRPIRSRAPSARAGTAARVPAKPPIRHATTVDCECRMDFLLLFRQLRLQGSG